MAFKHLQFLAVTGDPTISQTLSEVESQEGWHIVLFSEPARVFSAAPDDVALLLLDEAATGPNYLPIIKKARKRYPSVDVIVVGGPKSDEVRSTDKAAGVDYYYERPVDAEILSAGVHHRMKIAAIKSAVGLVGRSREMEEIMESVVQLGPTDVPILLEGESGTGKDVVARAIHESSRRASEEFVAINVASLAEGVLESELFGHEKGAFTGAVARRAGVFERADGGTLFLDEVGEMSANMQVRLLRVLESGEVLRVGGVKSFNVDVRIIAATNRNLGKAVASGSFRQDLYYRLKGVGIHLPPLRQRQEDIPILANHFVRAANRRHKKDVKTIERDALKMLVDAPWPGNIRELRNLIDTCVVLASGGRITADLVGSQLSPAETKAESLLPVPLHRTQGEAEREMIYASVLAMHRDVREILAVLHGPRAGGPLGSMKEVYTDEPEPPVQSLTRLERQAIVDALKATGGNRRKSSEILGISERTLYRKIKEYGIA